ncbi:MAG: Arc family DNA-binding protein [Pseudomonadales bacterium]|nr:Arc family DNA-binding protein [Pseudomonadales bacterium]
MANITLKNIPDNLYNRLKEAANLHHRSINSELIYCLERTLMPTRKSPEEYIANAQTIRKRVKAKKLSIKEIQDFKNQGPP